MIRIMVLKIMNRKKTSSFKDRLEITKISIKKKKSNKKSKSLSLCWIL